MLAAYNYNYITYCKHTAVKNKKREKNNIITPLHIYNGSLRYSD